MILNLSDAAIKAVAAALENQRPEQFSAYTPSFKNEIGAPWNYNDPSAASKCAFDGSEIHYSVIIRGITASIDHIGIHVAGAASAKFRRVLGSNHLETGFQTEASLTALLDDPSGKSAYYRVDYQSFDISVLQPSAVEEITSWYVVMQLNNSTDEKTGIKKVWAIDGVGNVNIHAPEFYDGYLLLRGDLQ